jgi:hypothetical protein
VRLPGARLVEYALVAAIFCGSLALWIAVPIGSLWLASLMSDDGTTVMLIVLIVCPLAMLAFAMVLVALHRVYLRSTGTHPAQGRSAWLGSLSGSRRPRRPRGVLDTSMTISALIALVLFLVWFLLFAENTSPAGFVP